MAQLTHMDKTWEALNKIYGGKNVTLITTMRKLLQMSLRLPQGPAYNKIKALSLGMRTARVSLEADPPAKEYFFQALHLRVAGQ